ncbi:MAG: hypothetical protein GY811_29025 [Myxococcales bacterium]|nr:hypothetical protein [Myxococcales bacterium]
METRHLEQTLRDDFENWVRRGVFDPTARHISPHIDTEDRLQDSIAATWERYRSHGLRGKVLSVGELRQLCRWKAIDLNRQFVPSDGAQRLQDALSVEAYRRGRVEVLSLDEVMENGLARSSQPNPQNHIDSASDVSVWLDELAERDCELIGGRLSGETLTDTGKNVGLSASAACARLKKLGHELADRLCVTVSLRQQEQAAVV